MKRLNDGSDVPEARLGILLNTFTSSKKKTRLQSTFPRREWVLPAASTKEPEDREFVVDSGASMHMVSKKDLNSAELETMRTSRSPTTVMTANGEVQTREEATVARRRVPKACRQQAAAGGSRTCVCANTFFFSGWHTQEEKGELTSCRGTV